MQRARRRLRLDQATFALAVGLAALLAVLAIAGSRGLEIARIGALPLSASSEPETIVDGRGGSNTTKWSQIDRAGRVRYETERTALLGAAALDQLNYDWAAQLPDWRIDFVEGNDRVAGYTWSQEHRIEVFVRPRASSSDVARILAHELGHAVDVTFNTGDERVAWLQQRGAADGTPWWPSSGAADFETGAGDFAECFAVWLVGPDDYRSVIAPAPSDADLALIARLAG